MREWDGVTKTRRAALYNILRVIAGLVPAISILGARRPVPLWKCRAQVLFRPASHGKLKCVGNGINEQTSAVIEFNHDLFSSATSH
jgi:hypothetical protein